MTVNCPSELPVSAICVVIFLILQLIMKEKKSHRKHIAEP